MSKDKTKEKPAKKPKEIKKKSNWFQNTLLGLVIFICGILFRFFPQIVSSIIFIAFGIIFLFVGITDGLAALKYKDDDDDWKTPLIAGVMSIFVSILFVAAYWMRIPNITNLILVVISIWGILRCLVLLYGIFKGSVKRKGSIISALVTGVGGLLLLIFHKVIMSSVSGSGNIIGYILIAVGVVITFFGLYQRADAREKKEKAQRDMIAQKAAAEALKQDAEKDELKEEAVDEEVITPPVI